MIFFLNFPDIHFLLHVTTCNEAHVVVATLAQVMHLGPVVQSIVSLTSSLRGQLIKCCTTLLLITLIFFVE